MNGGTVRLDWGVYSEDCRGVCGVDFCQVHRFSGTVGIKGIDSRFTIWWTEGDRSGRNCRAVSVKRKS